MFYPIEGLKFNPPVTVTEELDIITELCRSEELSIFGRINGRGVHVRLHSSTFYEFRLAWVRTDTLYLIRRETSRAIANAITDLRYLAPTPLTIAVGDPAQEPLQAEESAPFAPKGVRRPATEAENKKWAGEIKSGMDRNSFKKEIREKARATGRVANWKAGWDLYKTNQK